MKTIWTPQQLDLFDKLSLPENIKLKIRSMEPTETLGFAKIHLYATLLASGTIRYAEDIPLQDVDFARALALPHRVQTKTADVA